MEAWQGLSERVGWQRGAVASAAGQSWRIRRWRIRRWRRRSCRPCWRPLQRRVLHCLRHSGAFKRAGEVGKVKHATDGGRAGIKSGTCIQLLLLLLPAHPPVTTGCCIKAAA